MVGSLSLLQKGCTDSIKLPKGGLEPPHPCGYCALNAARLPIPPLRRWLGIANIDSTVSNASEN